MYHEPYRRAVLMIKNPEDVEDSEYEDVLDGNSEVDTRISGKVNVERLSNIK